MYLYTNDGMSSPGFVRSTIADAILDNLMTPSNLAVGDINGDTFEDVLVVDRAAGNVVFVPNDNGNLESTTTRAVPLTAVASGMSNPDGIAMDNVS